MYISTMMSCRCTNAMNGWHMASRRKGLIKIEAFSWAQSFSTNLPLCISIIPSGLCFSSYTHIVPIASYFDYIAAIQFYEFCASSKKRNKLILITKLGHKHSITIQCKGQLWELEKIRLGKHVFNLLSFQVCTSHLSISFCLPCVCLLFFAFLFAYQHQK